MLLLLLQSPEVVTSQEKKNQVEAVINMQESTHKVPNSASQVVLSRIQLAYPRYDPPNWRFALGARD